MTDAAMNWTVPIDHPALAGHFPGNPILPGVVWLALILELAQRELGFRGGGSWRRVRFLQPVAPGGRVSLRVTGDAQGFSFTVDTNDGSAVARGRCSHVPLA